MVEVFKTNVTEDVEAVKLLEHFNKVKPHYKVNFDLQDCDKIFRVESAKEILVDDVISILQEYGFKADILPDI
ncbi:MAG: hypothetical protein ICV66_10850 [Chitinophagaceae bacterium]|nr:hypothetical protein [Chitinophagaceae bacterium]